MRTKPSKYKTETNVAYEQRCQRWNTFLAAEPRPDLWFISEDEVLEYFKWSGTGPSHYERIKELTDLAKERGYD